MNDILHLRAPENWINDPNGFIYYKGKYHLFYQYFPYAPVWGTMHWGHAVSDDMIHWKHLGVALFPTKEYDANGIFSGSAIEKDGKMHLYYTAVKYNGLEKENIHHSATGLDEQSQAMIISENGYDFDNFNAKKHIIPIIEDTSIGDPHDCRDPKVWYEDGKYYMVLASTHKKEEGVLLLYVSDDAVSWNYHGRLQDKRFGYILECPDIFEVDGNRVLICSPMGVYKDTEYPENQATMQIMDCDIKQGEVRFSDKDGKLFDYGMDLYAPQSTLDEEGRRTVIGWARMPEAKRFDDGKAWNGVMSLPRVVNVKDGQIYTDVHPMVKKYFDSSKGSRESCYTRRICHIGEGEEINIDEFIIKMVDGCIHTDRTAFVPDGVKLHTKCSTPYIGVSCDLVVYNGPDIIEVYINNGLFVVSNVKY